MVVREKTHRFLMLKNLHKIYGVDRGFYSGFKDKNLSTDLSGRRKDGYGRLFFFNSWKVVFSQFLMFRRFPNCLLWKAGLLQIFYGFKTYINSMICRPSTEASRTEVGIKDLQ